MVRVGLAELPQEFVRRFGDLLYGICNTAKVKPLTIDPPLGEPVMQVTFQKEALTGPPTQDKEGSRSRLERLHSDPDLRGHTDLQEHLSKAVDH
ncbi:hypothetical protein SHIRM173S_06222 [Streptomyces hirsutus]